MVVRPHSGKSSRANIALISTPWHLANRPCLALGVLKGYLAQFSIAVDCFHLHLPVAWSVGLKDYHQLAMDWEVGESIFAMLVAPAEEEAIRERLTNRLKATGRQEAMGLISEEYCRGVAQALRDSLATICVQNYPIIGFSVAHLQLMSSLYLARLCKEAHPEATIVFGGRGVAGEPGRNLMRLCREVDLVVDGEGEEAMRQLGQLEFPLDENELERVPNLWFRGKGGEVLATGRQALPGMEDLPFPDFSEFFENARLLGYPPSGLVLPLEASRGCAWEHRRPEKGRQGCAFCSLNRNWPNYREKSQVQVLAEINAGIDRYQVLDLAFADVCLPRSYRADLLKALLDARRDLTIFCEIRPDLDEETASLLALTGTRKIQVGIESFSTAMLARLGKGVRAIDNVLCLKICEEHRIPCQYNLLTGVPGTTPQEIEETLAILPRIFGFRPPSLVPLYLGRGSPMHRFPERFGIDPESRDQEGSVYLPSALAFAQISDEVSYRSLEFGGTGGWPEIAKRVGEWVEARERAASILGMEQPLSYRDGGSFLTITDLRRREPQWCTLVGLDREVLLACRRILSLEKLGSMHPGKRKELYGAVDFLEQKDLLLREGQDLLALPVPALMPAGIPRMKYSC